ncbi:MAG: hypothetical protein Q8R76_02325 [Candidatus Omnitrophota bacterium]|nr:hypothetical protein [Candidatus Omnitrophota bacterium]
MKTGLSITGFWKFTAFHTLVFFSMTTILWSAPSLTVNDVLRQGLTSDNIGLPSLVNRIEVPETSGSILKRFEANSSGPSIVHIQDAHTHYEAQQNIRRILNHLSEEYQVQHIFLEGAMDRVDPELMRYFKDTEANRDIAELLAKEGVLGGAELFLLQATENAQQLKTQAHGVEDPDLYRRNIALYQTVYADKEIADNYLTSVKAQIVTRASHVFGKKLRNFFREWLFYQDIPNELLRQLNTLRKYAAEELGVELGDAREQIDWPQLVRFFRLQQLETEIDFEKAGTDKGRLIAWIREQEIGENFAEELSAWDIKKSFLGRQHADLRTFLEALHQSSRERNFSFETYGELKLVLGAAILRSEISATELFDESERLTARMLGRLAATPEEEALVSIYKDYVLSEKLFSLELVSEDHNELESRFRTLKPSQLIARIDGEYAKSFESRELTELDGLFEQARDFYRVAVEREEAIFENMTRRMKEQGIESAVLITGGFHATGLHRLFEERGFSYANVVPHMLEVGDSKSYTDLLMLRGDSLTRRAYLSAPRLPDISFQHQLPEHFESYLVYHVLPALSRELLKRLSLGHDLRSELRSLNQQAALLDRGVLVDEVTGEVSIAGESLGLLFTDRGLKKALTATANSDAVNIGLYGKWLAVHSAAGERYTLQKYSAARGEVITTNAVYLNKGGNVDRALYSPNRRVKPSDGNRYVARQVIISEFAKARGLSFVPQIIDVKPADSTVSENGLIQFEDRSAAEDSRDKVLYVRKNAAGIPADEQIGKLNPAERSLILLDVFRAVKKLFDSGLAIEDLKFDNFLIRKDYLEILNHRKEQPLEEPETLSVILHDLGGALFVDPDSLVQWLETERAGGAKHPLADLVDGGRRYSLDGRDNGTMHAIHKNQQTSFLQDAGNLVRFESRLDKAWAGNASRKALLGYLVIHQLAKTAISWMTKSVDPKEYSRRAFAGMSHHAWTFNNIMQDIEALTQPDAFRALESDDVLQERMSETGPLSNESRRELQERLIEQQFAALYQNLTWIHLLIRQARQETTETKTDSGEVASSTFDTLDASIESTVTPGGAGITDVMEAKAERPTLPRTEVMDARSPVRSELRMDPFDKESLTAEEMGARLNEKARGNSIVAKFKDTLLSVQRDLPLGQMLKEMEQQVILEIGSGEDMQLINFWVRDLKFDPAKIYAIEPALTTGSNNPLGRENFAAGLFREDLPESWKSIRFDWIFAYHVAEALHSGKPLDGINHEDLQTAYGLLRTGGQLTVHPLDFNLAMDKLIPEFGIPSGIPLPAERSAVAKFLESVNFEYPYRPLLHGGFTFAKGVRSELRYEVSDLVGGEANLEYLRNIEAAVNQDMEAPAYARLAIYLASGADISTALLATDADEYLFVERRPFINPNWTWDESTEKHLNRYVEGKQFSDYGMTDDMAAAGETRSYLRGELEVLGAANIIVPGATREDGIYEIFFTWQGRERKITYVSAESEAERRVQIAHVMKGRKGADYLIVKAGDYGANVGGVTTTELNGVISRFVGGGGHLILDFPHRRNDTEPVSVKQPLSAKFGYGKAMLMQDRAFVYRIVLSRSHLPDLSGAMRTAREWLWLAAPYGLVGSGHRMGGPARSELREGGEQLEDLQIVQMVRMDRALTRLTSEDTEYGNELGITPTQEGVGSTYVEGEVRRFLEFAGQSDLRDQLSFDPSLEGARVHVFGFGMQGYEILAFLQELGAGRIDAVSALPSDFRGLDRTLKDNGLQDAHVDGYLWQGQNLISELAEPESQADIVFLADVVDERHFTPEEIRAIAENLIRYVKPGGLLISAGQVYRLHELGAIHPEDPIVRIEHPVETPEVAFFLKEKTDRSELRADKAELAKLTAALERVYAAVALDVDGTLLDGTGDGFMKNIHHIIGFLREGVPVAIVTGNNESMVKAILIRTIKNLLTSAKDYNMTDADAAAAMENLHIYVYNGAKGFNAGTGEVYYNRFFDELTGHSTRHFIEAISRDPGLRDIAENSMVQDARAYGFHFFPYGQTPDLDGYADRLNKFFEREGYPLEAKTSSVGVDVFPKGVDKGYAIADLALRIGAEPNQIAKIADRMQKGGNDDAFNDESSFAVKSYDEDNPRQISMVKAVELTGAAATGYLLERLKIKGRADRSELRTEDVQILDVVFDPETGAYVSRAELDRRSREEAGRSREAAIIAKAAEPRTPLQTAGKLLDVAGFAFMVLGANLFTAGIVAALLFNITSVIGIVLVTLGIATLAVVVGESTFVGLPYLFGRYDFAKLVGISNEEAVDRAEQAFVDVKETALTKEDWHVLGGLRHVGEPRGFFRIAYDIIEVVVGKGDTVHPAIAFGPVLRYQTVRRLGLGNDFDRLMPRYIKNLSGDQPSLLARSFWWVYGDYELLKRAYSYGYLSIVPFYALPHFLLSSTLFLALTALRILSLPLTLRGGIKAFLERLSMMKAYAAITLLYLSTAAESMTDKTVTNELPDAITVGKMTVEGRARSELRDDVEEAIAQWAAGKEVELLQTVSVDGSEFRFVHRALPVMDAYPGMRETIEVYAGQTRIGGIVFRVRSSGVWRDTLIGGPLTGVDDALDVEALYRERYEGIGRTLLALVVLLTHARGIPKIKAAKQLNMQQYEDLGFHYSPSVDEYVADLTHLRDDVPGRAEGAVGIVKRSELRDDEMSGLVTVPEDNPYETTYAARPTFSQAFPDSSQLIRELDTVSVGSFMWSAGVIENTEQNESVTIFDNAIALALSLAAIGVLSFFWLGILSSPSGVVHELFNGLVDGYLFRILMSLAISTIPVALLTFITGLYFSGIRVSHKKVFAQIRDDLTENPPAGKLRLIGLLLTALTDRNQNIRKAAESELNRITKQVPSVRQALDAGVAGIARSELRSDEMSTDEVRELLSRVPPPTPVFEQRGGVTEENPYGVLLEIWPTVGQAFPELSQLLRDLDNISALDLEFAIDAVAETTKGRYEGKIHNVFVAWLTLPMLYLFSVVGVLLWSEMSTLPRIAKDAVRDFVVDGPLLWLAVASFATGLILAVRVLFFAAPKGSHKETVSGIKKNLYENPLAGKLEALRFLWSHANHRDQKIRESAGKALEFVASKVPSVRQALDRGVQTPTRSELRTDEEQVSIFLGALLRLAESVNIERRDSLSVARVLDDGTRLYELPLEVSYLKSRNIQPGNPVPLEELTRFFTAQGIEDLSNISLGYGASELKGPALLAVEDRGGDLQLIGLSFYRFSKDSDDYGLGLISFGNADDLIRQYQGSLDYPGNRAAGIITPQVEFITDGISVEATFQAQGARREVLIKRLRSKAKIRQVDLPRPSRHMARSELRAATVKGKDQDFFGRGLVKDHYDTVRLLVPEPLIRDVAGEGFLIPEPLQNPDLVMASTGARESNLTFAADKAFFSVIFKSKDVHRPFLKSDFIYYGKTLEILPGTMRPFREDQERTDIVAADRTFAWWFRHNVVPFAQALGYEKIGITIVKGLSKRISQSTLRELGFREPRIGGRAIWIYDLKPEQQASRSELGVTPDPLKALRRPALRQFIRDLLVNNYSRFLPEFFQTKPQGPYVDIEAWVDGILQAGADFSGDPVAAARFLNDHRVTFDPGNIFRWGGAVELRASLRDFEQAELEYADRFHPGPRVFDVGGGSGRWLSGIADRHPGRFTHLLMSERYAEGYNVTDERIVQIAQSGERIPLDEIIAAAGGDGVESAQLRYVLHHTYGELQDPNDPAAEEKVVEFLSDVRSAIGHGGQLFVYEDTYPLGDAQRFPLPEALSEAQQKEFTERFLTLSEEDKYLYMVFTDWYWNVFLGRHYGMSMAYRYYPMEKWVEIFNRAGFEVERAEYLGFLKQRVHGATQGVFVLRNPERSELRAMSRRGFLERVMKTAVLASLSLPSLPSGPGLGETASLLLGSPRGYMGTPAGSLIHVMRSGGVIVFDSKNMMTPATLLRLERTFSAKSGPSARVKKIPSERDLVKQRRQAIESQIAAAKEEIQNIVWDGPFDGISGDAIELVLREQEIEQRITQLEKEWTRVDTTEPASEASRSELRAMDVSHLSAADQALLADRFPDTDALEAVIAVTFVAEKTVSLKYYQEPALVRVLIEAVAPEIAVVQADQAEVAREMEAWANVLARLVTERKLLSDGTGTVVSTTEGDFEKRKAVTLAKLPLMAAVAKRDPRGNFLQNFVIGGPHAEAIHRTVFSRNNDLDATVKAFAGKLRWGKQEEPLGDLITEAIKEEARSSTPGSVISSVTAQEADAIPEVITRVLRMIQDESELRNLDLWNPEEIAAFAAADLARDLMLQDFASREQVDPERLKLDRDYANGIAELLKQYIAANYPDIDLNQVAIRGGRFHISLQEVSKQLQSLRQAQEEISSAA